MNVLNTFRSFTTSIFSTSVINLRVINPRVVQCFTALLVGLLSGACRTMTPDYTGRVAPLQERTFVAHTFDKRDSIMYEAQIVPHLYLIDNFETAQLSLPRAPSASATRLYVSPMFRVRQLRDSSAAVRTPSFMPSVMFEKHWLTRTKDEPIAGTESRTARAFDDIGYRAGWTHHSNGQAGCFFNGYTPSPSGDPNECVAGDNADTTGVGLNRASGDFSTSYWSLTGMYRSVKLDASMEENSKLEVAVGYQLHKFGVFGDMRSEQRKLYGTHRARVDAAYTRRITTPLELRVHATAEVAERTHPAITNWRIQGDVSIRSPYTRGTGLLVRYMDGQDYYNIGFVNRRKRLMLGIVIDPGSTESLRRGGRTG